MATGYFTTTTHAELIPESWRKEVILSLYDKILMRKLISELPIPAGTDLLHFPNIAKLAAEEISQGTPLVGKVNTEGTTPLTIDQNWAVPMTIGKRLLKQAQQNINILNLYKERAAEAMAYQLDQALLGLYSGLSQSVVCKGTATTWAVATAYSLGDFIIPVTPNGKWYECTTAGTSHASTEPVWPITLYETIAEATGTCVWTCVEPYIGSLNDSKILEGIQYLDEANAPQDNRHLVITPAQKNFMLKIDKFVDASKLGATTPILTGRFGQIYGINVWVTNAIITATTRQNLLFHRDFALLGIQEDVAVEVGPYMPLKQGYDVVLADLYGYAEMRDDFAVVIKTST